MLKDKKELKRLYDIEYRRKNKEIIAEKKKADYEKNREENLIKYKKYRSKPENIKRHNEYCRQPEYIKKKRLYDVVFRAMKYYGDFWKSAILVNQLEIEIRKRIPKHERSGYKRNVRKIISVNIRKRFESAIVKILNGDINKVSQIKNFGNERKQFLESLIIR